MAKLLRLLNKASLYQESIIKGIMLDNLLINNQLILQRVFNFLLSKALIYPTSSGFEP